LRAGVVWIIDPHDKTVLIYRKGAELQLVLELQGFRVPVAQIFA
jgi:hypothetical protein